MLTDAQITKKRTAQRMATWLDDVKRGPQLRKLLRALEVRGLRLLAAPQALRDLERVAIMPATALPRPRTADLAPAAHRIACMSFEGCGGTGRVLDYSVVCPTCDVFSDLRPEGGVINCSHVDSDSFRATFAPAEEYCFCAAGTSRRAADVAGRR